jgi:hypothetical protein
VINTIKKILVISAFMVPTALMAQVASSVTGRAATLWAGGEYSNYAPDYGSGRLSGIGGLFDFNVTPKIGVVGEARWLRWGSASDSGETQSDYLAGVKYRVIRFHKLDLNAKFLIGGVWINFPVNIGSGSYFALEPGAHVDYHFARRFIVRGSYEYQLLPTAPNIPGQPSNGLTPNGFSVGVLYNIFSTQ